MLFSKSVAQFVTDRLQWKSEITEDLRATQGRRAACLHHTPLADSHSARLVKQQVPVESTAEIRSNRAYEAPKQRIARPGSSLVFGEQKRIGARSAGQRSQAQ
jgi:hypothetical protein